MKEKIYKRTIYRVVTRKFCGAVAVDQNGYVFEYDTAPCFRWMSKKKWKFHKSLKFLRLRNDLFSCEIIDEDIDPF